MRAELERENATEAPDAPDAQRAVLQAVVALHAAQPAGAEAAAQARRLLVDTVGCALAGRHAEEVRRLEAALAACEPGDFSLPAGPAMSVQPAAQVLAMAATWDEACEGHALAHGRPGVPLVAALLPLALKRGASLGEFVDAFVLGYEVGARCGAWLRIRPGMHVDANWPALGVAAGVARLLGLAPEGIVQAIDIAACQLATSLYLPVAQGRTARNTYLGHSASLGLQAAFASAAGIDAPEGALAHYAANHAASSAQLQPQPLPGASALLLRDAYLKPFAAVRHVHYGATAARKLREQFAHGTARASAASCSRCTRKRSSTAATARRARRSRRSSACRSASRQCCASAMSIRRCMPRRASTTRSCAGSRRWSSCRPMPASPPASSAAPRSR
jgi:2-methylcitrate dehydratase PrpD